MRSVRWVVFATAVAAILSLPAAAAAAPMFGFQQALYAQSPQVEAHLGQSVAIDLDTIVVGEPDHVETLLTAPAVRSGAAYVYTRSGGVWTLQAKLLPPVLQDGAEFGASVAIDGDNVVVGAPKYRVGSLESGAAFAFARAAGAWSAGTALTSADATAYAQVGASVAIRDVLIAVGAPRDSAHATSTAGTARAYGLSGGAWQPLGTLHDPAAASGDGFGGSVAIDGPNIFVGAPMDAYPALGTPTIVGAGSVQRFNYFPVSGWSLVQTIYAPTPGAGQQFGGPLSASAWKLIAGDWQATISGTPGVGEVYVFTGGAGAYACEATLVAPMAEPYGYFGSGVGIDGDTAVVGAFFSNSYNGRAHIYSRASGAWELTQTVNMVGYVPSVVQLGTSAAISGSTAVFGAQMAFAPGGLLGAGGAYVFTSPVTFWGMATDAGTGLPVPGIEVSAYVPDAYGEPDLARLCFSDPNGMYAMSLPAGDYRLGWMDPSDRYYAGFHNDVALWSTATTLTTNGQDPQRIDFAIHAKPTAWMSKLTSPASVRARRRFTVSGYLKPRHPRGSAPVTIECYRLEFVGGSWQWVLRSTFSSRARDYRPRRRIPYYTRFTATVALPASGKWRIRAVHPADAVYAASASPWRGITVR